jgi:23S rRNA pseudouridine1911/1915/1917 synthase
MQKKITKEGARLDSFLAEELGLSRSLIQKKIKEKKILVNDKIAKPAYILAMSDKIFLDREELEPEIKVVLPQNIPLEIVWEDEDVVVINKKVGMVVHPAIGNFENTLVNALKYWYKDNLADSGGRERLGIVHRLDKDTEGLMVIAKNNLAYKSLTGQFKQRLVQKKYYAMVHGNFRGEEAIIKKAIGRLDRDWKKMGVLCKDAKGTKEAISKVKVLKRYNTKTLLEVELKTGRTHQIRVHLSYLGYPVLGDTKYAKKNKPRGQGHLLQAYFLAFDHPKTGKHLEFCLPISERFKA